MASQIQIHARCRSWKIFTSLCSPRTKHGLLGTEGGDLTFNEVAVDCLRQSDARSPNLLQPSHARLPTIVLVLRAEGHLH
jgi:hypothetical protein